MRGSYSSKQFSEEYEFKTDKEFELDGVAADWAVNGHRFWGDEDERIDDFEQEATAERYASIHAVISPDSHFLTVAVNHTIRVYDVESGVQTAIISEIADIIHRLAFCTAPRAGYTLLSSAAGIAGSEEVIYLWSLDTDGHLIQDHRLPPMDIDTLLAQCSHAIEGSLEIDYRFSRPERQAVFDGFAKALAAANALNRMKHVSKFYGALTGFNSVTVSHDGSRFMYQANGQTTQHGMRPADELPQMVVVDLSSHKELSRLKGHTDAIMWSSWSYDDTVIATACWDETFRLWSSDDGTCRHVIGPTGVQNWAGCFLPDGQHILLSGGKGDDIVAVYDIATGQKVEQFQPGGENQLNHWMREICVHPSQNLIILANKLTLLGWRPRFTSGSTELAKTEQILRFTLTEDRMVDSFAGISQVGWAHQGRYLLAQSSDDTLLVWDTQANRKWRFQRPKGRQTHGNGASFAVKRNGHDWVICVNADGVVRFWRLQDDIS